jgi:hypothetical protein
MSKFDDEYRASVVVMLQAEGYPENPLALGKVHNYLKQRTPYPSKPTLINWFHGYKNPPPLNKVNDKKGNMLDSMNEWAWVLMEHGKNPETVGEMTGQQAATSFGIILDKIRLLQGLPTQIVAVLPEFVSTMQQVGEDPENILRRMIERAKQRIDNK